MNSPSLALKIGAQCPKALTTHVIQWLDSCVISLLKCGLLLQHDSTKVVAGIKGIKNWLGFKNILTFYEMAQIWKNTFQVLIAQCLGTDKKL